MPSKKQKQTKAFAKQQKAVIKAAKNPEDKEGILQMLFDEEVASCKKKISTRSHHCARTDGPTTHALVHPCMRKEHMGWCPKCYHLVHAPGCKDCVVKGDDLSFNTHDFAKYLAEKRYEMEYVAAGKIDGGRLRDENN